MDKQRVQYKGGLRFGWMLILLVGLYGAVYPQSFGKNKVQYRAFDWKYVQSKHFDVYYYGNEVAVAEFVADVAETSYVALKTNFRQDITKRIPIVVYNGHNEFEQTNVTTSMIEESVGGFTEVFKDRIVIPFQGNYDEFRHVIHHELTHAVMFQIFYGSGVGSVISGMTRFQPPLWFAEGLAEYESLGWDTDSDMFMRDATLNGYVPPIQYMSGYMVYKGGQSLMNYIAEKYGEPKIAELIGKIRMHKNVDQGVRQAVGLEIEDLSDRWQKYLRKRYWPDIQRRDEPEDVAKRLTDHAKKNHFLNNAPSLSPKGDKLVYLSDQTDYMDIYLMNTADEKNLGRLVKGQRSDMFEELHWSRPGMGWSPDGSQVVFSSKAGSTDAIHIIDIEKREVAESYPLDLDGIFSPTWSPKGDVIAFMGVRAGQADIYLFDLKNQHLEQLTDDMFSDMNPSWSPDGKHIAFVSDRGAFDSQPEGSYKIQNHNYRQHDIYTLDCESKKITRQTSDSAIENNPVFSPDGSKLAYISDVSGINNIYMMDLESGESYPITNVITGISQFSWSADGTRLAFASFYNGGYDIYMMNNPLEIEKGSVVVEETEFIKKQKENQTLVEEIIDDSEEEEVAPSQYKHYVFGENFKMANNDEEKEKRSEFLDQDDYKNDKGGYKTHKYKLKFTPDYVSGGAGYSQYYGIQGTSMLMLSDILGNHQISIYTDLFYNLENSNIQLAYYYLPKRTDYGISVFHYSYLMYSYYWDGYWLQWTYFRDRYYGASLFFSRPFDKYKRIDMELTGIGLDRDFGVLDPYGFSGSYMNDLGNLYRRRLALINLGYTTDTVLWGETGPVNGARSNFSFTYSPLVSHSDGLEFYTARMDLRKYYRIGRDYTFSLRLAAGASDGRNPQKFLLGGMRNWINYKYNENTDYYYSGDIWFSTFITPFRGGVYYEMIGDRFVLTNIEFRFPLIHYLILGWPVPVGFQNIRGTLFMDVGSAWEEDKGNFKPFESSSGILPKLDDLSAGYGFGLRVNLGIFLLKYDAAWKTDWASSSDKPMHYFTLGAEF